MVHRCEGWPLLQSLVDYPETCLDLCGRKSRWTERRQEKIDNRGWGEASIGLYYISIHTCYSTDSNDAPFVSDPPLISKHSVLSPLGCGMDGYTSSCWSRRSWRWRGRGRRSRRNGCLGRWSVSWMRASWSIGMICLYKIRSSFGLESVSSAWIVPLSGRNIAHQSVNVGHQVRG